MNPDFDIRIKSVIKALEEVVLPAIPQENSLAREQATVAVGHLKMIGSQWAHAERYAHLCLADSRALGIDLLDCLTRHDCLGQEAHELTSALAANMPADCVSVDVTWEKRNRIVHAIDAVLDTIANYPTSRLISAVDRLVLQHSTDEHRRDRTWFRTTGLDPDGATLPPLEEILARARPN